MGGLAVDEPDPAERVRLHITPFNPALLDKFLGPSTKPLASNISFHAVQTFPERGFGFVEVPVMEAQKLKKKLNGSTLKGAKVRIEEAKPEKKRKSDDEAGDEDARKVRKKAKKEKKRREMDVLPGHELEQGRRVKRGWAENDANRKKGKNKAKDPGADDIEGAGRKLRFKTVLPPNTVPLEDESKDKSKVKKAKDGKKDRKKVVVDEFGSSSKIKETSNSTDATNHGAVGYEDGKGWVDEAGHVVEPERASKKPKRPKRATERERRVSAIESSEVIDDVPAQASGAEHDMPEDDMSLDGADAEVSANPSAGVADEEESREAADSVHPLEALFKRPKLDLSTTGSTAKPRPTPIDTSFSFFNTDAADEDGHATTEVPPQTPHTKQDLEWRSLRSAAPTPDTAAIGRHFSFPFAAAQDDEDAEEQDDRQEEAGEDAEMQDADQAGPGASSANAQGKGEESAFRKWFYENRGDLNRGWKKRRRDERKQLRQRENRRLSRRIA